MKKTEPHATTDEQPSPARPGNGPTPTGAEPLTLPPSPAARGEARPVEADPEEIAPAPEAAPLLASGFALPRLSLESVLWVAIIAAALIARLASLTNSPLSAAEAQRAYAAWQFADGQPTRVDGGLWGPFPFLINGFFFFLFGARDGIARLAPALAGVALVPACWWLRAHLGRWGALGTAAMLALSPTFVYGARQVTGITWTALAALVLFICLLRLAEERRPNGTIVVAAVSVAFLIGSGPAGLTTLLVFALAAAILTLLDRPDPEDSNEERAPIRTLGAHARRVDRRVWYGVGALVGLLLLAACSLFFTDLIHLPRTLGALVGRWWDDLFATDRNEPWYYYLMVAFAYEPFIGVCAIVGLVLMYRAPTPRPLVMSLPFAWQLLSVVLLSMSGGKTPETAALFLLPLAIIGGLAVEWTADRLRGGWFWRARGWVLAVAAFVTALALVQFARQLFDVQRSPGWIATILAVIALILGAGYVSVNLASAQGQFRTSTALLATLIGLAGIMSVRAMSDVAFSHPADGRELLIGTHTAASVTPFVQRVQRISIDLTRNDRTLDPAKSDRNNIQGGNTLAIGAESSLEWPFRWYFRDFPNFTVGSAETIAAQRPTTATGAPAPQLVLLPSTLESQGNAALAGYVSQQYPLTVAFPDGYRTRPADARIVSLFKPQSWADWLRYFVAHEPPDPPTPTMMTAYLNKEAADKVYFAASAPSAANAAPSNLFDHAGKGKAGGQFANPRGIVVAADGTITIVDQLNYRVQQFAPDGTFLRQWGGIGSGPDKFGQINGYNFGPTGIAAAPDGTIYVADTWNHRIAAFTADGKPVRQWGKFFNGQEDPAALASSAHNGDFYGPRGIAIGPNGLLYVTDTGNSRIEVFDGSGKFVRAFGSLGSGDGQLDNPIGIAARADGTIAVADTTNARIVLFNQDGQYQGAIAVPDWGTLKGIEAYPIFLPNGNLLVPLLTNNRLAEMTTTGAVVRTLIGGTGDLHKPVAIALTPDGATAIVVNDENSTVVKVSLA